tara:strand:+ start:125069 stop:126133 length:1065 start_codon:yes stop_codon:yes gene_type:complete
MTTQKSSPRRLAIIGGGPIGLYLSLKLAQRGHKVSVFEKGKWPIDKVCGQGIMPTGRELLESVGVEFSSSDSYEFQSIQYIDGAKKKKGSLTSQGIGVERQVLSQKLYELASKNEQITLHEKSPIALESNSFNKFLSEYDFVFACDGLNSQVRKFFDNEVIRTDDHRMGARLHYNGKYWGDGVEVYWNDGIEAYVTPVSDSRFEVAFLWFQEKIEQGPHLQSKLLNLFPELKEKLKGHEQLNDFKGYGPFNKVSRHMRIKNVYFVGDAYKFLDGITGEGLSLGMKSATILAQSFDNFSLFDKLKIHFNYLTYGFWVGLALSLSRRKTLRKIILSLLGKKTLGLVFKLNDSGFKA